MCAADLAAPIVLRRAGREVQEYGTLVVCGGGCYGSYYVRQLLRAEAASAVRWGRLLVVDQDADCRVAREGADVDNSGRWRGEAVESAEVAKADETADEPRTVDAALAAADPASGGPPRLHHAPSNARTRNHSPAPRIVLSPWTDFFAAYLADAATRPERVAHDAIVPSPLMPHLMFEWLLRRASERWPSRSVAARPLAENPGMPWHRHAESNTYVSFAEWMCPINCIEPARCPETRGPRDWSIAPTVQAYVAASASGASPIGGPALLHCTHRAYGVGMFDTSAVLAADRIVGDAGAGGAARVLVGTVSHCHGALGLIEIGA